MELVPDKQEILRYLGHHGQELDLQTQAFLDICIKTMTDSVKPRFCYRIFSLESRDSIVLPECSLPLPGESIKKHLNGCGECVLLAATLGIEADNLIRISEAESMTQAVIYDACATELTEVLCDRAEEEIKLSLPYGLHLTSRFSPGYGDFPITLQHRILEILDAPRKLGLTVTEHSLMLPRKSVTAILGITTAPCHKTKHHCAACSFKEQCQFQKEDSSHES